jgi:MOSC domain-containing protein YiiM
VVRHPDDARWYARVLGEGRVAVGDRVEVARPVAIEAGPAPLT